GLASPLVGAVLENATLFVAYNRIQDAIRVVSPPPALSTNDSSLAKAPLSLPQMFVAGALAGTVASFLLTPVELVKCKIQVQNMVAAAEATASKGSSSPRLHQSRTGAAAAATAHQARSYTTPTAPKTSVAHALDPGHLSNTTRTVPATAAAAAAAGPMDVVSRTWRRHGLRGFYVGHMATMVRETGGSAAWFGVYEVAVRELVALRERERAASSASGTPMTKADLATTELLFAGALAGVSYNVVLFPADTVKSFQQTEEELRSLRGGSANTSSGQAAPRSGFWKVGFDLYRAQGLRGLYRGALLVTIKSVPTSAVIFGVYEGLNRHF
ncbi:mitochondrial carrier domain-containing protein, partial [Blastocladiella britannica]